MPSVPVHGGPPVAGEVHRVQQPDLRPGREVQAGGRSIQEGEATVLCSTMSVQLPWQCVLDPWNNGKEVPRWGVAEIQKMSPSTTGRCSRHAANQSERGTATRQPITQTYYIWRAGVVGKTIFDIRRPDMVERIGSYLPPKFPLFYDAITQSDIEAWFVSDPKVSKRVEKALF